jgi:hypothetical protein
MTGTERRAQRILAGTLIDTIPEFAYAICAVGHRAPGNPDSAEVAFHCAHGYGLVNLPAKLWLKGGRRLQNAVLKAVAWDHIRRGVVTDIREHWMVVAL